MNQPKTKMSEIQLFIKPIKFQSFIVIWKPANILYCNTSVFQNSQILFSRTEKIKKMVNPIFWINFPLKLAATDNQITI